MTELFSDEHIQSRIRLVRRHQIIPLADLARFYGVARSQLLAHAKRFPGDFCFALEGSETLALYDGAVAPRPRTYAFTEHGASVVAYLLATPRAVTVSAQLRRAFREVREAGVRRRVTDVANETTAPDPAAGECRPTLHPLQRETIRW